MNSQYPGQGPGAPGHAPDPLIGQTIGNYLVRQKLGEGGMGSVYLAEHPHIGKKVALKILHAEFASNQDVVSRFFNEAKAVNDIGHPNIVDIVDYGVIQAGPMSGEGMVYFIMEFLSGLTLTDLLRRESPMAPERALTIALSVADALSASHKCGIVHRDLKPDNIMLSQRGRERDFVKLLDFGIAKLTGDQPGSRRTRTGIVMGTPAYMSPEQCEGRGNVDHRTDIYALGIVLYEMITGRVPFVGDGYGEILVQHLTQMPVAPSTIRGVIPPHVEAIVMKALNKRPDDRYPNMDEMMKALADPVGYVETHGGLQNFHQTVLVPSNTPLSTPGGIRLTPSPLSPLTPVPGSMTGIMGQSGQTPTTLGASSGQVAGSGRKVGIVAGIGVLVAGAIVAAIVLAGGDDKPQVAQEPAGSAEGSAAGATPPTDPSHPATQPGNGTTAANGTAPAGDKPAGDTTPNGTAPAGDTTPNGTAPAGDKPAGDNGTAPAGDKPAGDKPAGDTAAAMVSITVESKPPGGKVYFAEEKEPRGVTPLTFEVAKADKTVEVAVRMDGFGTSRKTVNLSSNQSLDVLLVGKHGGTPAVTTTKPPVKDGGKTGGKDGKTGGKDGKTGGKDGGTSSGVGENTLNPFGN